MVGSQSNVNCTLNAKQLDSAPTILLFSSSVPSVDHSGAYLFDPLAHLSIVTLVCANFKCNWPIRGTPIAIETNSNWAIWLAFCMVLFSKRHWPSGRVVNTCIASWSLDLLLHPFPYSKHRIPKICNNSINIACIQHQQQILSRLRLLIVHEV